jgi:hypothetical protein
VQNILYPPKRGRKALAKCIGNITQMKISHAKYTEYDTGGVKEFNSPACLTGMSTSDSITTCKREGAKPIVL